MKKYLIIFFVAWTVLIVIITIESAQNERKNIEEQARIQARGYHEQNIAYRNWISGHGGVYVPITEHSRPNPYLTVPGRDVTTVDGKKLTLVNPAWMTREVYELIAKQEKTRIASRLVSLKYLNPKNKPDSWEEKGLISFEKGEKEFSRIEEINGEPYLRLMRPFMTEQGCLKCHGQQDYKEGDVRGAISITIPIGNYYKILDMALKSLIFNRVLMWTAGALMIFIVISKMAKQQKLIDIGEERFRVIAANTPDHILMQDSQLRYVFVINPQLGMTEQEMIGKTDYDILSQGEADMLSKIKREAIETANPVKIETSLISRAGRKEYFEGTYVPKLTPDGKVDGLLGYFRNVTDRKQTEARIIKAKEEWERTFDAVPDLIALIDGEHRITRANKAMAERLGTTPDKLVGRHCYEVVHCLTVFPDFCPHSRLLKSGKEEQGEFMDKELGALFEVRTTPVRDETGQLVGSVHILRDITERRKLEDQLRQSQKMEAIGTLAGGVAHDFNNIIQGILGFSYIAQSRIKDDEVTKGFIGEIVTAAKRAAELTHGLLAFSRKQTIKVKEVELNAIVRKMQKMIARIIGEDIEFKALLSNKELPVLADPAQIDQVLLNLVTNARDAMPEGGELVIRTEEKEIDRDYAEAHLFENPGRYAVLTVSDTGLGIDLKTRENIFEPFFTTKEVGKGTGLGLAMVYGIVKQHKGNIEVESTPGKGATFMVYLPISAPTEPPTEAEQPVPVGKGETILLAEDDAAVRNVTRLTLESYGYNIIEAANGEEAIRKFHEQGDSIALLLLDVIMPLKNGWEAYEEIKTHKPGIKAIFISGYTDDKISKKGTLEEGLELITKPYDPGALARKIREALDGQDL